MSVLTFAEARHLVSRTGFGPEPGNILQFHRQDRQLAIEKLLNSPRDFTVPEPELHSFQELRAMRKISREEKIAARKRVNKDLRQIKLWAIEQALQNPNALQEKMVWFWHNHFTSAKRSSGRTAELLMRQTRLIRQHALGNFADLLRAIPYDPLMLVYLDGVRNVRGKPNENFARELLELFTLGEGHYSEQDIKEIARAFTGWRIKGADEVFHRKKRYDSGKKTVFGQSGNFDGDDIIEMLLEHPRTAEYIAEKMWSAFVSITPPDIAITKQWANVFRRSGYDITTLLHSVLSSQAFWHPAAQGTLVKSPLDLVIGTLRTLKPRLNDLPLKALDNQLRRMGQDIYSPPNVKGWPGGMAWVSDFTLPIRHQFTRQLTRGSGRQRDNNMTQNTMMKNTGMMQNQNKMRKTNAKKNTLRLQELPMLAAEHWEQWLLPQPAVTEIANDDPRMHLRAILLDPAYQLK